MKYFLTRLSKVTPCAKQCGSHKSHLVDAFPPPWETSEMPQPVCEQASVTQCALPLSAGRPAK